ncbi:phosphate ABC transporter permease PstA [Desulfovibrio psychrotolerans]|uniref:Phosphate transport system permease protein PstA n=1 Tax=Desulfovibrio psychrotolerans TaxID=415242 RepID=A0A7J0BQB3_9BACT|nr:phosphate ABC transporter permease PstA [Desulfovibrio psychrotolerans]GFM35859.1 phosphate transport system permease protein PstA [Desulfovibrio psychrotolerans]
MASTFGFDEKAMRARRHARERRFRAYAITAIALAGLFLVFFMVDISIKGASAFRQGELLITVNYSPEIYANPNMALDPEVAQIVSRSFIRLIPSMMDEDSTLSGTTRELWVLASADTDQYMKERPNRLKPRQQKLVDSMMQQGTAKLAFNTGFFTSGDSKLPELAGIFSAAVGSFYVLLLTLLFSFPVAVMCAIYLEEFAPDNRLTQIIEVNINNLAAIPSIIYGLLGLAIFINFMGVTRSSVLVGGLTLSLMTMPSIIISTRAAIRSIPPSIREAALALGATPLQVVWHHVLPLSLPGILTGTIIGLSRAMGETAPLLIVGMMAYIPDVATSFSSASTVLPAQIYTWASDSQRAFAERTAAGIMVLLVLLLSMNATAIWLRNKYERKW